MVLGSRRAYSVDPDYDIISGSSRAARISSIAADDGATLSAMSRERDRRLMDNITTKMNQIEFENVKPSKDVSMKTGFRRFIYSKERPPLERESRKEHRKQELRYPWDYTTKNIYRPTNHKCGKEKKEPKNIYTLNNLTKRDQYPEYDPLGLYRPRPKRERVEDPADAYAIKQYDNMNLKELLSRVRAKTHAMPKGRDASRDVDLLLWDTYKPLPKSFVDGYESKTVDGYYEMDNLPGEPVDPIVSRKIEASHRDLNEFNRMLEDRFRSKYRRTYVPPAKPKQVVAEMDGFDDYEDVQDYCERELGTVSDYPQTSVRTTAVTRGVPIMNSPSWYYTYYSPKYEAVNYDNYPSYSVTQRGYYPFYYPNKYSYQPYVPRYSNDVYTGSQPYIPKYYKAFADSGYPYIPRYYRQAATDRAYSLDLALPKKSAYSYEVAIPKKPTYSYSLAPATPTYSNDLYAARQSYSYNLTSSTPTYSIDYATPRVPTRVDSLDLATLPSRYRRPYSSVYPYYRTGVESLDLATLPSRYRRPFYAGYPYYGSVYSYPYTYGNWGKSQRRSLDAEVDAYLTGSRKYYPNLDYFYPFYDTPYRIAPSLYSIYGYRPYFSRTMRGSWEVDGFPYQHTSMTYIPVEVDTTSKASPKLYKSAGGRVARAFEDAEVDAYLNSEAPRRPPPKTELRTERSGALASVPSRGRSYSLPGGRPRSRVADLEVDKYLDGYELSDDEEL